MCRRADPHDVKAGELALPIAHCCKGKLTRGNARELTLLVRAGKIWRADQSVKYPGPETGVWAGPNPISIPSVICWSRWKGWSWRIKDLESPYTGQQQYIQEESQWVPIIYSITETRDFEPGKWVFAREQLQVKIYWEKGLLHYSLCLSFMPRLIFFCFFFLSLKFYLFYLEGGISRTEGRYEKMEMNGIEMQVVKDTHTHTKTIIRKFLKM